MPCYEAKKSDGGPPMQWGIVRPRGKDYSIGYVGTRNLQRIGRV